MANKKINQLVSKTSILSTDLFGIGDATTGQLFKKTIAELQAAIGGAVISVNGLVGTVVLDTDDIQELATPTNKYFTDARARGAISLTVTGNSGASTYSSGTGVLNVPTYTLAGLGGITASFLSGASGISYNSTTGVITYSGTVYTDASIRALLSGGTGISYNSSTGAISYSGTVYTDSSVRALISLTTTGNSGASTYNNTTGVINVPEYTLAGLGGISLTSLSGGTGITYNSSTGAISYSGTVYTDASVRALVSAGTGLSYNNTTGVFTSTITQYTDALARASISITTTGTSGASTYNSTTGVLNVPQYQGVITLTTTGTSGAATFSSNTLNIPQYAAALSGTTNYVSKFTSSTAIGNSQIFDNGTTVFINATSGGYQNPKFLINNGGTESVGFQVISDNGGRILRFQTSDYNNTSTGSSFRMAFGSGSGNYGTYLYANSNGGTVLNNLVLNDALTIDSTGKCGIGTSTPDTNLTVWGANIALNQSPGNLNIYATTAYGADVGGSIGLGGYYNATTGYIAWGSIHGKKQNGTINDTNGYLAFLIRNQSLGAVERMRITADGNILMGTTSNNGERLYVSGNIRATGSITANSDISLKKNLLRIENALEKVEQINGYTYELKEDDSKRHAGVIAQEIETVLPEIVNTGKDGLMGVEYGNISALLIEAIKEQQTQIKELKALLNK